ncbi:MAG: PD-(D/E)XK nuclease family protein [Clostridia bacterium]|nr:PD-(D/E)XK nuclease family protein [Clostridia bacterium]
MINSKPNIFEFATKELSQDAMFMYLFDCFNSTNTKEHEIGKDFLKLVYEIQGTTIEKEISKIIIKKQYHNIDILALIEYEDNYYDVIIVEDKTYSSEHDNQLRRYYNDLKENGIENVNISNIFGVYFKLGQPNIDEKKALYINNTFEYKILNYNSFLEFLNLHKKTNFVMELIYEFYEERLKDINLIDNTDFSNPIGHDFDKVLSDRYSQDKYTKWIITQIIGEDKYYPENQYGVMNFGQPCTQYRFVFTQDDEDNKDWDCVTSGNISKYCYFFRIDWNSKGWYIAINQYDYDGDKCWEEKRRVRDKIREAIRPIEEEYNLFDKADNRGKKESKICLFSINSFESVTRLLPALKEIYNLVLNTAIDNKQ